MKGLYTFHNVSISLKAKTGKQAYTALCNALARLEGYDFTTDTYSKGVWPFPKEESTKKLFPKV